MKHLLPCLLVLVLLLAGCSAPAAPEQKQYTASFLTLFDTVTTIVGRADSEEDFQANAQQVHDALLEYHQLFDVYNDYDGINNLKTINDNAGIAPVRVERPVIDLLLDCRSYCESTGGRVNAAMGSVLYLWHEARSDSLNNPAEAYLPGKDKLEEASQHMDFSHVIIDESASTVFIDDPALRLDVGAIAKGWAVQRVADQSPAGLLISVGGNVCATGPKDSAGTPWVIGIQNPDGGDYLHTVYLSKGSVVTSGDYQRAYSVNGRLYHHIIDPETLFPAEYWRSVTIICDDSADADALSTALFLLPREEGQALLDQFGAEAMWVDKEGKITCTDGFEALIRT